MAKYYKGYYMMTARCNLACSYCILENKPHQLKQELSLSKKMELIAHLYHRMGFRSLTLSGGEVLIIGKSAPSDFLILLDFLKQFKSKNPEDNLQLNLYSNGIFLDETVATAMKGIIDEVSINIDSCDKEILLALGRNKSSNDDYFSGAVEVCRILSERGIRIKIHSVISDINYQKIGAEVQFIYDSLKNAQVLFDKWKFYQYMSYDDIVVDTKHQISTEAFSLVKNEVLSCLKDTKVNLHFKDNQEMNQSLFNILATGVAQYMVEGDTWATSKRSKCLLEYQSMNDFFERNKISVDLFNAYHTYNPNSINE